MKKERKKHEEVTHASASRSVSFRRAGVSRSQGTVFFSSLFCVLTIGDQLYLNKNY